MTKNRVWELKKQNVGKEEKSKSWSFKKINKIGKPLAKPRKKLEKIQIIKIRNERGHITN